MRTVQLFIEGERVELFNDETISLTQTIQNVKDIGKVFANFTQSFTLPASKTNNQIFKHYYNYDIDNAFDARKKVSATIEINHLPFEKGKLKLDGVQLKDNKAYAYKVTFYGDIVDLKDIIGDDKLGALDWLSGFSITYTPTNVQNYLTGVLAGTATHPDGTTISGGWTVPLISNTTRLFYDSSVTPPNYFNSDGSVNPVGANLYPSANYNGVYYEELTFGMRIWIIVKAIEESYTDITFSSDSFIKQTSNPQFYDLYMWLLRDKGYPIKLTGTQSVLYNGFTSDYSSMTNAILLNDKLIIYNLPIPQTVGYILTITSSGSFDYIVTIKKDGITYATQGGTAGATVVMSGYLTNTSIGYQIYIESTASLSVNYTAKWELTNSYIGEAHDYGTGSNVQVSTTLSFNAQDNVPNVGVLDFLTGLFKMFNLTAYKNADGEIVVKTLDDFYAAGVERDITEYVDVSNTEVNVALPYKDIKFQYKGRGTNVAKKYEDTEGIGWGTVEYRVDNELFGETYTVEVPFEHMQFEKIASTVQTGSSVDDSDKSYYGLPLLFYKHKIVGGTTIRFLSSASTATNITNYHIPMNSVSVSSGTDNDTCHFSVEVNEYAPTETFDGSLFANYYQTYIEDVFNPKRRLIKVKAKLPISFLVSYTLADTLVIADRKYKINSITTNLNTGESDLELLNVL